MKNLFTFLFLIFAVSISAQNYTGTDNAGKYKSHIPSTGNVSTDKAVTWNATDKEFKVLNILDMLSGYVKLNGTNSTGPLTGVFDHKRDVDEGYFNFTNFANELKGQINQEGGVVRYKSINETAFAEFHVDGINTNIGNFSWPGTGSGILVTQEYVNLNNTLNNGNTAIGSINLVDDLTTPTKEINADVDGVVLSNYQNETAVSVNPTSIGFAKDGYSQRILPSENTLSEPYEVKLPESSGIIALEEYVDEAVAGIAGSYQPLSDKKSTLDPGGSSDYPSSNAILNAGLLRYKGNYDASVNLYPSAGGSGASGSVKAGDTWYISVLGTLGSKTALDGMMLVAKVDTPGQTDTNWFLVDKAWGFVPANAADKQNTYPSANSAQQYYTVTATNSMANSKANASEVSKVIYKSVTPTTGNTSTTETQVGSTITISANSFDSSDVMKLLLNMRKSGDNGVATFRVRIGSTNVFASSTIVATFTFSAISNNIATGERLFTIKGGNLEGLSFTASSMFTDKTASNLNPSTLSFNPVNANYVFLSIENASASDTTTFNFVEISK